MERQSSEKKRAKENRVVEAEYAASDADALSIKDAARGDNLPNNYFLSFAFIGTVVGLCLGQIAAYIFLILPTNVLTFINEVLCTVLLDDVSANGRSGYWSQQQHSMGQHRQNTGGEHHVLGLWTLKRFVWPSLVLHRR
jgi:hypothetical protein